MTTVSRWTGCARTSASCLSEARRNRASLPATALVDQFYADVQAMGGGRWDTSSLLARLERTTEDKA
jgi:3-hydroxyisobutyrate dehydrogenase-like beta-hydroxyacid dehydrogenase